MKDIDYKFNEGNLIAEFKNTLIRHMVGTMLKISFNQQK